MPVTKSDIPDLILPGLRAEFARSYRAELDQSTTEALATVVNTTLPNQRYAWLGAVPPMREFIDERQPSGLSAYATSIEDRTFESTIAVDRRALEDDQLDLIRLRVRDLAHRVALHRHQLVVEALANGGSGIGFDGVPLFSGLHPTAAGTLSNTSSADLDADGLGSAINAMMSIPDESDIPLGIVPDTLVVGPALQWAASELIESPVVVFRPDGSATASPTPFRNAFQGRLRLIVSPFIRGANADKWFLLDTSRPIRSIILQQRSDVPVEFTAMEQGSGEASFMRDRFYYGVRGRYNVGFGLWQTAYRGGA